MNWNRFNPHGEDATAAFEALTGHLFERWCRRAHGAALREVRFVNGQGGDGGVEAYAVLGSGEEIGLQAKWFRGAFGRKQIAQIEGSLRSAIANHPRLSRYVVAIPRALNADRDKRAGSASTKRRPEMSEWRRWEEWQPTAKTIAPRTEIVLWDDAAIEDLLTEHENEGLLAYWFTESVITLSDLKRRFDTATGGWLRARYLPDLHAVGFLEQDLALRLGEPAARGELLREVETAIGELAGIREDVARLGNYPSFLAGVDDAGTLRDAALVALKKLLETGETLAVALRMGGVIREKIDFSREADVLRRLDDALSRLDGNGKRYHSPTHETAERLRRVLWENQAPLPIARAWNRLRRASNIAAFVGRPGIGKTHGLAHAVEERLGHDQPALLLRARDCPTAGRWAEILRQALDRPTLGLDALLNALEALAVRADVWRARQSAVRATEGETTEVAVGPTCFLLAVDGLEESGDPARWGELLGELAAHLTHHPRIRAAVTLRTTSRDAILGWTKPETLDVLVLPSEDADVQRLLRAYCERYGVQIPDRRLRWAIRDPLSVRLFCELSRGTTSWSARRQELSLPNLLKRKIALTEEAIREKGDGWSPHEHPLHTALSAITSAYVRRGPLPREDAIDLAAAAQRPSGLLTPQRWSRLFDQAAEQGLVLVQTQSGKHLRQAPISCIEPAYDPLTDYLIAEVASEEMVAALQDGEVPRLGELLIGRPDALSQAAILLAEGGVDIIARGLWRDELSAARLEELQLGAIAALDNEAARPHAGWVRDRLLSSMPSCRRVLAGLCIPVARDETHPFGPRFVHEALLPFLPAKRDLFWSGPSYLPGDGGRPGNEYAVEALERLTLEPEDRADGPPLLLAWVLTSVDNRWRRHVRRELSQWGSKQLDELVRWLNLTVETNDPQMVEDVAMVAFGAACLAGADPKLGVLAAWADANFLAPDALHRREDIVVLHAARGIVERARFMGATVESKALGHAKQLYSTDVAALPIDAAAAKEADEHWGVHPIGGDLARYVVPGSIEPFFDIFTPKRSCDLDPRAQQVLAMHAAAARCNELTPQKLAFGVAVAHLRAMGWDVKDKADWGAPWSGRHEPGTHGARSQVSSLVEKYVWTGCYHLQAYLAGRLPAEVLTAAGPEKRTEPPVDPFLVSDLISNPASDASTRSSERAASWSFRPDGELAPQVNLEARIQVDMADEWIRRAPAPDLHSWLRLSKNAAPSWSADKDWVVLWCEITTTESFSQSCSLLRVSSFVVPTGDAARLKHEGAQIPTRHRRSLSQHGGVVRCHTYGDPFDAAWAPWVTDTGAFELLETSSPVRSGAQAASAGMHWQGEGGEARMILPASWLRTAMGLAGATRQAGPNGEEWRFVDRHGDAHAVHTRTWTESTWERRESLLVRRSSLEGALGRRGAELVWAAWLHRYPNPYLYDEAREKKTPWEERNYEWLAFLTPTGVDVLELPAFVAGMDPLPPEPSRPEPPPPLVLVGPTNPHLATKLETELDDENAIPYFLWDDPMTVGELRRYLATASPPERDRLLGKILREARDPDVWRFTSPGEVVARFDALSRHLGRRLAFWKFLLGSWEREGLLVRKSA